MNLSKFKSFLGNISVRINFITRDHPSKIFKVTLPLGAKNGTAQSQSLWVLGKILIKFTLLLKFFILLVGRKISERELRSCKILNFFILSNCHPPTSTPKLISWSNWCYCSINLSAVFFWAFTPTDKRFLCAQKVHFLRWKVVGALLTH